MIPGVFMRFISIMNVVELGQECHLQSNGNETKNYDCRDEMYDDLMGTQVQRGSIGPQMILIIQCKTKNQRLILFH